jgi:hypothetical protein
MPGTSRSTLFAALAAALALSSACGDVQQSGDAGPPDDAVDVAPGPVTIVVNNPLSNGAPPPLEGQIVLFFDPRGELLHDTTTDAEGTVTRDVPPGTTAVSVHGLEPGDVIELVGPLLNGPSQIGSLGVSHPSSGGAAWYQVSTGCTDARDTEPMTAFPVHDQCVDAEGNILIVGGTLDDTLKPLGHYVETVAFPNDQGYDFSQTPLVAPDTLDLLVDLPGSVDFTDLTAAGAVGALRYQPFTQTAFPRGEEIALSFPVPADFGDGRVVTAIVRPTVADTGTQRVFVREEPSTTSLALTGEDLLPWYSQPIFSYDTRQLRWTSVGDGGDADVIYAGLQWTEKGDGTISVWYAIAPPDAESLAIPHLPEEYAAYGPRDPRTLRAYLNAVGASELAGYQAARRLGLLPDWQGQLGWPAYLGTPPLGRITHFEGSGR